MPVVALSALAVGCLIAALATSLPVMVLARVIQGLGGGVLPLSSGIIRDEFPPAEVPGAIGLVAGLTSAGAAVGVVLAGPIVSLLGLAWLFWLPMIVLLGAALAAYRFVPESRDRAEGAINWPAAVLLSAWLVALLLAVSRAPVWGWTSPRVLVLLGVAVVLAAGWVLTGSRVRHPLVDMRMMRLRAVWTTNLVALLFGVAMYAAYAFLPQFVQTRRPPGAASAPRSPSPG